MRRPYTTRTRVAMLREQLTDRERAIIATIDAIRVVTGGQLQRLHFQDLQGSALSQARQARRVLAKLVGYRLLARLPRRIGGVRAGSSGFVYSLDVAGQRLVGLGRAEWRPRPPWNPSLRFLQHRLAVTEIYVRLAEAERAGRCQLDTFATEPACWRRFRTLGGQLLVLKPDAFVRLGAPAYEDFWFLELDRGHESPWTLRRKCDRYYQYWLSGEEEQRNGVFPAVLWSVPDQNRAAVLGEVLRRLPKDAQPLFRVACFSQTIPVLTASNDREQASC